MKTNLSEQEEEHLKKLEGYLREEIANFFRNQRVDMPPVKATMQRKASEVGINAVDVHRLETPSKVPSTLRGVMRAAYMYGFRMDIDFVQHSRASLFLGRSVPRYPPDPDRDEN